MSFLTRSVMWPLFAKLCEFCQTSTQLLHARINQRISSLVSTFNILGLISSSPAAFPDFIPFLPLPLLMQRKLPLPLNASLRVCHESMPLQDSKDLQSTGFKLYRIQKISIVKGFHSHPLNVTCRILNGVCYTEFFAT